jgi:hypothetical protein
MKTIFKVIYLTSLVLILFASANAQNLYIVGSSTREFTTDLKDDYTIELLGSVGNTSLVDINAKVMVKVQQLTPGHSYDVCWKGSCLPADTTDMSVEAADVVPAQSQLPDYSFYSHYHAQYKGSTAIPGTGKLLYVFYNVSNPDDKAELTATFTFTNGGSVSEFLSNPEISVVHSMDNLLTITAENEDNYQVNLYGLNGASILSSNFRISYNSDLNNLSAGVYIFSITKADGKKMTSGKIVIK